MNKAYFYDTLIGRVLIAEDDQGITEISLISEEGGEEDTTQYEILETNTTKEAAKQLTEYLEGNRIEFTVRLNPHGTEFQRKVWNALKNIPYGETRSYKQIAEEIDHPKASRAVGMANHKNPIICIIPCHRVIGTNGSLIGYAGGLEMKEKLLTIEKLTKKGSK